MVTIREVGTNRSLSVTMKRSKNRSQQKKGQVMVVNPANSNAKRRQVPKRRPRSRSAGPSDYLRSLLDPEFQGLNSKIPDLVNAPSGTFQLTLDGVISVPATLSDAVGVYLDPNLFFNGQIGVGVNTAIGGPIVYALANFGGQAAAQALYTQVRPVSACIKAEFTGNTLGDSGIIALGQVQRGLTFPLTANNLSLKTGSQIYPARMGGVIRYRPTDNLDLEFTRSTAANLYNGISFITSGMQPNSSMRYRIVVNYEGIPANDTSTFVNATSSPVNLAQLQSTQNYLGAEGLYAAVSPWASYFTPFAASAIGAGMATGAQRIMGVNQYSRGPPTFRPIPSNDFSRV